MIKSPHKAQTFERRPTHTIVQKEEIRYCEITDNYITNACQLIISKPTFVVAFCEFWLYSCTFLTLPFSSSFNGKLHASLAAFCVRSWFWVQQYWYTVHSNNNNWLKIINLSILHKPVWQSNKLPTNGFILPWASPKYSNLENLPHSQYHLLLWPDHLPNWEFHDTGCGSPTNLIQ